MYCKCGVRLKGIYNDKGMCSKCTKSNEKLQSEPRCHKCNGLMTPVLLKLYEKRNNLKGLMITDCVQCQANRVKNEYNKLHQYYTRQLRAL